MLFKRCCWVASACLLASSLCVVGPALELMDTHLIWNESPYNSFGDLIWFHNQWFCSIREAQSHAGRRGEEADGKIRVISSSDGQSWSSSALIEESGTDLRDPHLSITADGRLMIVAGGSKYPDGVFQTRRPRVAFSKDGRQWTAPKPILQDGDWLWRVTWHGGKAYGVSKYGSAGMESPDNPRRQNLVVSSDGLHWSVIAELKVPGGDETTVRFLRDNRMVALMRCEVPDNWQGSGNAGTGTLTGEPDNHAVIGVSSPPYKTWEWKKTKYSVGGPNFIVLPDGRMIAGGRFFQNNDAKSPKMAGGFMSLDSYQPELILPSSGDSSYPGFVYQDGVLWTSYYSSPEAGKTAMYLAKIRVQGVAENSAVSH